MTVNPTAAGAGDVRATPTSLRLPGSGQGLKVGIVRAVWNSRVTEELEAGVRLALGQAGVVDIVTELVAGTYELPFAAKVMAESKAANVDAVVCIGCLLKGETLHMEYIADAVTHGLMRVSLDTCRPVVFGVLTVFTKKQALARAGLLPGDSHENEGEDWGWTAVKQALLRRQYQN